MEKPGVALRQSIMLTLIILCMLFLFERFFHKPRSLKVAEVAQEIRAEQEKLQASQNLLSQLAARKPSAIDSKASQDLLEKYVKSNDRFSKVVSSIASENEANPYQLNRISAEKQTQIAGYSQTLYNVELEATFISVGKFLERLEDSPLLTEVDSIEITRLNSEMKRCKTKIRLFSYVAKGGM